MANCADDLTQIDYDASAAANAHLASTTSSSSSNSLFPLIEFNHSHALNIDSNDPDNALKRVLRPLDSRDAVLDNQEIVGTAHEGAGGVWTAGSIETQEGDDELIIHVRTGRRARWQLSRNSHSSPSPNQVRFSELVRIKYARRSRTAYSSRTRGSTVQLLTTLSIRARRTILIGTGGGRLATSPRLCRVWVNRGPGGTTFDEAASDSPKAAQEFELLESEGGQRGAVEYPVRIARFANCSDVDLVSRSTFQHPGVARAV